MPIEIHECRVPTPGPAGQPWELAATVFLPPAAALPAGPDVLVLVPGGGYSRGYFNLPVAGTSQAMYHAGRGNVIVAIDPLDTGDSSEAPEATAADAAATLNTAVTYIKKGLTDGTLITGTGPVAFGAAIGAGHSLGGHLLISAQAAGGLFKGIALLGTTMLGMRFPLPSGASISSPQDADFGYAYYWDEVPESDAAAEPTDLDTLVGVDAALGLPTRTSDAPWASRRFAGYVPELVALATAKAAEIDYQVLVAAGERDLTHPLDKEAAVFTSAAEVATFSLPKSAHAHNFATTREQLWARVDRFVHHSSTFDRRVQVSSLAELAAKTGASQQ